MAQTFQKDIILPVSERIVRQQLATPMPIGIRCDGNCHDRPGLCVIASLAADQITIRPDDQPLELERLLLLTSLGDRAAFARIYSLMAPKLFHQLHRILRRAGWAEEVLQEVFVKIWLNAHTYQRNRSAAATWMSTIARHAALDRLDRRDGRDEQALDDLEEISADPALGPMQLLIAQSDARQIRHCLDKLPARLRQSIALAYFQGLSHREVANHLEQPVGTIKTQIRRALGLLKECIG